MRLLGSLIAISTTDQPVIDAVAQSSGLMSEVNWVRADELSGVLAAVSETDVLLGTRRHSPVFAVISGTPLFGIPYREKVRSLANELGGKRSRVLEVDWQRPRDLAHVLNLTQMLPRWRPDS